MRITFKRYQLPLGRRPVAPGETISVSTHSQRTCHPLWLHVVCQNRQNLASRLFLDGELVEMQPVAHRASVWKLVDSEGNRTCPMLLPGSHIQVEHANSGHENIMVSTVLTE